MKFNCTFIFLLLLLSLTTLAQDFNIKIDAEKDDFYKTLTGPDDGWLYLPPEAFNNNGSASDPGPVDALDLSANWYSAWDDTYLYIFVDVVDDIVNQTGIPDYWRNDCFDAKVDPDFTATDYNSQVFCFAMTCQDSGEVDQSLWPGIGNIRETVGGGWVLGTDSTAYKSITPDDYARTLTDNGYICECRLKWDWIATTNKGPIAPQVGDVIGFAVSIHDNDGGASTRDNSIEWAALLNDNVWNNCTNMGHIELLADHKIKYVPESLRDPSVYLENPEMYIPAAVGVSEKTDVVKNFALLQNYPNPFNPVTNISYTIPKPSEVKISVYDFLGREVAILVNGMKPAGTHKAQFDGSNLSSGIYFYKLQSEGTVISKKMILIK
jgi:Carbohydrate family 9 binding domain-like/Secretion system C-terminal sorting domain